MAVSTQVPASWNLPLFWATVDGSKAGNLTQKQPALLVGQYDAVDGALGAGGANTPIAVGSPAQANYYFGVGSMLARMFEAWFKVNTTGLVYALPVPEPVGGVKGTQTITIGGSPTASGLLQVYIAGQIVQVAVASTDNANAIGGNLAAAINAMTELPMTAVNAGGTVTCTCKWAGLTGNDIQIAPNFIGPSNGEYLPAGVTCVVAPGTSGLGEPSFVLAIASVQMQQYLYVGMPYTDAASMAAWNAEFGFGSAGRWSFGRQQYGFLVNALRNDYADALTWGEGVNSPVMSTMIIEPTAQAPIWEWTAEYAGLAALALADDPARPLQTLEFSGILPAPLHDRFPQAVLNNLTNGGFAIQAVAPDGNPMILREQTQYQVNSFGQSDNAFALLTTLATLAELLTRLRQVITSAFGRVKLIPDGTRIGPGQAAVTPTDIKAEIITQFKLAQWDGLVSDLADFVDNLVVEIDDENPNRVNVLWPPQLAGQLRVFAVLAQYRLLYPNTVLSGGTQAIGVAA